MEIFTRNGLSEDDIFCTHEQNIHILNINSCILKMLFVSMKNVHQSQAEPEAYSSNLFKI